MSEEKLVDIATILTSRRVGLYKKLLEDFKKKRIQIDSKTLLEIISNLDNTFLLSSKEKQEKKISPGTNVAEIVNDNQYLVYSIHNSLNSKN